MATAPTVGEALANPLRVPELVAFTLGSTAELYACQWVTPRAEDPNPYIEYFGQLAAVTAETSTGLVVLAVAGFLGALYGGDRPDDLVTFGFYWGMASLVGYPFITDIGGAGRSPPYSVPRKPATASTTSAVELSAATAASCPKYST